MKKDEASNENRQNESAINLKQIFTVMVESGILVCFIMKRFSSN